MLLEVMSVFAWSRGELGSLSLQYCLFIYLFILSGVVWFCLQHSSACFALNKAPGAGLLSAASGEWNTWSGFGVERGNLAPLICVPNQKALVSFLEPFSVMTKLFVKILKQSNSLI